MLPIADLVASLKARWRLEVLVFAVVFAAIALWTVLSPRVYIAASSLLFDGPAVDPVQGTATSQDTVNALLLTQTDVIKSDAVASDVVRSLQLATPAVVARWQQATGGTGDVNSWYGHLLLSNLAITPVSGSRVLSLQYSSIDPHFAALMVNAFAASYLDTHLKLRTDSARTYSRWFQAQTLGVRNRLDAAQAKLTAYKRNTGIVDSTATDTEAARLGELSSVYTSAESSAADLASRAGGDAADSPDVLSSGVVMGLRAQIAAKAAQVSQMSTNLGPNHPDLVAAQAELTALRSKLSDEIRTATHSIRVASGAANSREAEMRRKLEAQRGRMLGLSADRAQLDVLQRDVMSAQAAYDAVTARLETMRLQSAAPETNAHQLDVADTPLLPSSPNVPLRLALGSILGVLVAIGVGLAVEVWRPRARTTDGVANMTGVPVLSAIDLSYSRAGALLADTAR